MKIPLTDEPCPRCMDLATKGKLRVETVQRLAEGAFAPQSRDGKGRCCHDCSAAETLVGISSLSFEMARVAVANERQEQYRLPGVPTGLVEAGLMRASAKGDFDEHLESHKWFGVIDAGGDG